MRRHEAKAKRSEVESRFRFSFLFEHDLVRKPVRTFRDHALGDGFTLCWREAAIKGLASVRHIDEKLRRLEPLAVSRGESVAHLDEILHTHAVNVRNGSPGKRREANAEKPALDLGNVDVVDIAFARLQVGEPGP